MTGMSSYVATALAICWLGIFGQCSSVEALTLQGSTTFNTTLIEPYGAEIAGEAGVKLKTIPNKSSVGLLSLFEGRTDLAMISTALPNEIAVLQPANANLPFERLQTFEIARVPAAFVVHPDNPIKMLPLATIGRILTGEIRRWSELGGADIPIRVVAVRAGGGVLATVEAQLLGKGHIAAPDVIRVQVGTQIVKVVAHEPGALGITQISIVRKGQAVELKTDQPIEQVLSLVSLGEPSDEARRLIEAMQRRVAGTK